MIMEMSNLFDYRLTERQVHQRDTVMFNLPMKIPPRRLWKLSTVLNSLEDLSGLIMPDLNLIMVVLVVVDLVVDVEVDEVVSVVLEVEDEVDLEVIEVEGVEDEVDSVETEEEVVEVVDVVEVLQGGEQIVLHVEALILIAVELGPEVSSLLKETRSPLTKSTHLHLVHIYPPNDFIPKNASAEANPPRPLYLLGPWHVHALIDLKTQLHAQFAPLTG